MKRKIVGNRRSIAAEVIKVCPTTQKACYPTRKTALTGANGRKSPVPLYIYKCPDCHYLHLTKRPQ